MAAKFKDIQSILDYVANFTHESYEGFLDPLSVRFAYHRAPTTGEHTGDPMVLILGNHSSGKSTFINHMLSEQVQRTGLAPIDDGFTILRHGKPDEREGHAIVTNPDLPFGDLEKLGPSLISHLKMKYVDAAFLRGVSLVDTPGMIDAADDELGRGYDFVGAVRWFVERSDVVLMFFDPDKPGTTGETLKVFTSALLDIDHKLLIVLNKMDQFRTLRDFARAYGALCWNLSKVIPRKDLPMIFNTYVPVEGAPEPALPLKDFADAREEVIHEINRAPARRIDNILTRMNEHARKLRVQAKVCSAAARAVRSLKIQFTLLAVAAFLLGLASAYMGWSLSENWWVPCSVAGGGLLAGVALYFFGRWQANSRAKEYNTGLTGVFETVYHKDLILSGAADDLRALWMAVHDRSVKALTTLGVQTIKPLRSSEERRLDDIIDKQVPRIRAEVHEAIKDLGEKAFELKVESREKAEKKPPPEEKAEDKPDSEEKAEEEADTASSEAAEKPEETKD